MFCVVNYNRLKLYKDKTRYTYKMSDTTIKIDRNLYPTYADYYVSPQYRKDYYQLNKKVIAEKNKKRYEENKEKIKDYQKEYEKNNKDKIAEKNKLDSLVWRGAVYKRQTDRQRFLDVHGSREDINVGVVKGMPEYFPRFKKEFLTVEEQLKYAYILSLEGNDVATNLKWVMSSNSIAIMPKPSCETWFMEGLLEPDVHYLEVAQDFSNLDERIAFAIENSTFKKDLIENANQFVRQFMDVDQELLLSLMVSDKAMSLMGNESYLEKHWDWYRI